jgi:uncharacterized cysteine cluster protein YcgN (CxxCxxCC family)
VSTPVRAHSVVFPDDGSKLDKFANATSRCDSCYKTCYKRVESSLKAAEPTQNVTCPHLVLLQALSKDFETDRNHKG